MASAEHESAPLPPAPAAFPGHAALFYPYGRETPHPLLSGALRRGKWTPEEEAYAAATIQYFLTGVLSVQYGTTLRGYIAQLLHCDPMRVSKKLIPGSVFVGVRIDPKIGRRSYYPCPPDTPGLDYHKEQAKSHMAHLRGAFIESIEREERQEQAATLPHVTQRQIPAPRIATPPESPFKRKRNAADNDDDDVRAPPLAPGSDHFHEARVPVLPSLTQLLHQTRESSTSLAAEHQHQQQQQHQDTFATRNGPFSTQDASHPPSTPWSGGGTHVMPPVGRGVSHGLLPPLRPALFSSPPEPSIAHAQ